MDANAIDYIMQIDDFLVLTYDELEALTGIHRTAWSRYFNRRCTISEPNLIKISNSLNMPIGHLWIALEEKRKRTLSKKKKRVDI